MDCLRSAVLLVALVVIAAACGIGTEGGSAPRPATSITEGPVALMGQGGERPVEVSLGDTGAPEGSELAAALVDARRRWASADNSAYHYQAELTHDAAVESGWFCGLGLTIIVQVVDRVVEQAEDINGCELDLGDPNRQPLTVEEWFEFLEKMLDGDAAAFLDAEVASSLAASFSDSGLPTSIRWAGDNSWTELWMQSAATGLVDRSQADGLLADLAAAEDVWAESGRDSYSFEVERSCFCDPESIGPFDVTVRNGEVVEATWNGEPVGERAPVELFTVAGLFDRVEESANHEIVTVAYDPNLGFPTLIDSNPRQNTFDDESVITVTNFTVLDR